MARKNPLVSVIVTTKNESKNIGRFFQSVSAQTYASVETILVDNNSSDDTKDIAKKYTKHVYNFGPERSAQRNFGVNKAKGDWVLILDADMELTPGVIEDCVNTAQKADLKLLVVPERTVGQGFISKVRQFEREMYMGDLSVEVARFFDRNVFKEFGGYDLDLTGPEDYDLPYRISKKYRIGRSKEYIYHHEASLSLIKLLNKKYYYASQGAKYAQKHPELVKTQGNLLFRSAYLKHWDHFVRHPFTAIAFIFVRTLETIWAIAGFIKAVGFLGFIRTSLSMLSR